MSAHHKRLRKIAKKYDHCDVGSFQLEEMFSVVLDAITEADEPTPEMVEAGRRILENASAYETDTAYLTGIYRAMRAAR